MRHSESIAAIAADLAKAQGLMDRAKRSGTNEHFRSRYPTLDDLLEVAKSSLSQCGIAFVQSTGTDPDRGTAKVSTMLIHASGEWMSSDLEYPVDGSVQALGGTFTYLKRQSLSSMLGISCDVDDDGEADRVTKQGSGSSGRAPAPPRAKGPRSDTSRPRSAARKEPAGGTVSATIAAVATRPMSNGGTRYAIELDGFSERWASTFDSELGAWAEANKGAKVEAVIARGPKRTNGDGYLWNLESMKAVTAAGGESGPDDIPF